MFGPVFRSEAVRMSRRVRHFIVRTAYALLLLFVLWFAHSESFGAHFDGLGNRSIHLSARFAAEFFRSLALLQLIAAIVVTTAVSAGTIAEERDRRTIEYLFLTHLTSAEIVLDKLFVRLAQVLYLMAAAVPVLALSLLFGGVASGQLIELVVATCGAVLSCASFSVLISVRSQRVGPALTSALLWVLVLYLVPLPLGAVLPQYNRLAALALVNDQLLRANPFVLVFWKDATVATFDWQALGWFLLTNGLFSAVLLLLAVVQVRSVALKAIQRSGDARRRGRNRRRALWTDRPMLWKEMFAERAFVGGRWGVWGLRVGTLGLLSFFLWLYYRSYFGHHSVTDFAETAMGTSVVLAVVMLLLVAVRCAGSISREREQQTWNLLCTTLLTSGEILLAKFVGSLYALRGIVFVQLALWALVWLIGYDEHWRLLGVLATMLVLCPAFGTMGLLLSQSFRSSTVAIGWSVAFSLVAFGAYLLCCAFLWIDEPPMLAPSVVFLLAYPLFITSTSADAGEFTFGYLLGIFGYLAVAAFLAVANLDQMKPASAFTKRFSGR